MKKISRYIVFILVIQLVFLYSCKKKENELPTVEIVAPEDGIMIMQGDQVTLKVKAEDSDGSIDEVRFYLEYVRLTEFTEPPYEHQWTASDTLIGDVKIRVVAVDNEGGAISDDITITVDTPGGFNPDLTYGTVEDIDKNIYKTIRIGEQNWMAENLRVTHYADGSPVPFVYDDAQWASLGVTGKAFCWYNNIPEYGDTTGVLYSWPGAMNSTSGAGDSAGVIQGVCPDGWHIPGDAEWKELEIFLGMSPSAADGYEWRGTVEGAMLKEKGFSHWENPNSGANNASGFTSLAGGFRSNTGTFYGYGQYAAFWSANEKEGSANIWYRVLHYKNQRIYRHYNLRNQGLSVRCVENQ